MTTKKNTFAPPHIVGTAMGSNLSLKLHVMPTNIKLKAVPTTAMSDVLNQSKGEILGQK